MLGKVSNVFISHVSQELLLYQHHMLSFSVHILAFHYVVLATLSAAALSIADLGFDERFCTQASVISELYS